MAFAMQEESHTSAMCAESPRQAALPEGLDRQHHREDHGAAAGGWRLPDTHCCRSLGGCILIFLGLWDLVLWTFEGLRKLG